MPSHPDHISFLSRSLYEICPKQYKNDKIWKEDLVFLVTVFYKKLMYFVSVKYDATATFIFIR